MSLRFFSEEKKLKTSKCTFLLRFSGCWTLILGKTQEESVISWAKKRFKQHTRKYLPRIRRNPSALRCFVFVTFFFLIFRFFLPSSINWNNFEAYFFSLSAYFYGKRFTSEEKKKNEKHPGNFQYWIYVKCYFLLSCHCWVAAVTVLLRG